MHLHFAQKKPFVSVSNKPAGSQPVFVGVGQKPTPYRRILTASFD